MGQETSAVRLLRIYDTQRPKEWVGLYTEYYHQRTGTPQPNNLENIASLRYPGMKRLIRGVLDYVGKALPVLRKKKGAEENGKGAAHEAHHFVHRAVLHLGEIASTSVWFRNKGCQCLWG